MKNWSNTLFHVCSQCEDRKKLRQRFEEKDSRGKSIRESRHVCTCKNKLHSVHAEKCHLYRHLAEHRWPGSDFDIANIHSICVNTILFFMRVCSSLKADRIISSSLERILWVYVFVLNLCLRARGPEVGKREGSENAVRD